MPTTILIVADHNLMRQALHEWVKIKFPGCQVIEAAHEREALYLAETHQPQVVILDLALPGMDGLQAIGQFRTLLPSTKVVVLTHYDQEVHRLQASTAGANAYLSKGKLSSELQPLLTALLA